MIISNSTGSLMLQTMLYLANHSNTTINPLDEFPGVARSENFETVCYGVYGCFPIDGVWTTSTRQINVQPQKPSEIEPRFLVFTGRSVEFPKFVDLNDPESVQKLGINPYGKFYFISHGYLEAGDRPWLRDMTKALLNNEPEGTASVVIIDWGGGSSPPYVQAVANIRLVGAITAHVIYLLYEELRMPNLDKVHFIGHSLGAHLAGYAGYTLQRDFGLTIDHITGLDPAEPLFSETDPIVRLDKSDAKYVDIIHTDANPLMSGGLGMVKPIGHVDFYPNGGYDQPGCGLKFEEYMNKRDDKSLFWTVQQFLGCNHIRSYQLYIESIQPKCPFTTITCQSYQSFKDGNCFKCDENGHHCLKFGFNSRNSYNRLVEKGAIRQYNPVVAYSITGLEKPFCRVHYRITVKMSSSEESELHGGEIGTLSFKLKLHKKETDYLPFTEEPILFEPGFQYTSVVAGEDIGNIPDLVSASWNYQTNLLNPLTWRLLSSPRIYVDYILIESLEYKNEIKLCPNRKTPIIMGSPNVLQSSYCRD